MHPTSSKIISNPLDIPLLRQLPFSQCIRCGDFVFVSGQVGLDPNSGRLVKGGIRAQSKRALENIKVILTAVGAGMSDIVKATVFLASKRDFAVMNEVFREYMPADPPVRSTVQSGLMLRAARVEIEVVAYSPDSD